MVIGQRVEHGTYGLGVVTNVTDGKAKVKFDNEVEVKCILLPFLKQSDVPPPKGYGKAASIGRGAEVPQDLVDYVISVGCDIWVEAKATAHDSVREQYFEATGEAITDASALIEVNNRPIMPIEWRVAFTAPEEGRFVYPHDVISKKERWRINRKKFIFELFSKGCRLGEN